jgi:hypothetical protein
LLNAASRHSSLRDSLRLATSSLGSDIVSQWTQTRTVWNKGQYGVVSAIAHMEAALLFALRSVDIDNGSEFLNWHLKAYLSERKDKPSVQLTRSRESGGCSSVFPGRWVFQPPCRIALERNVSVR